MRGAGKGREGESERVRGSEREREGSGASSVACVEKEEKKRKLVEKQDPSREQWGGGGYGATVPGSGSKALKGARVAYGYSGQKKTRGLGE